MSNLTIPNEFSKDTPADARRMNENFTAITDVVDTGLTNENVDAAAAIVETKIAFSATTGHTHNGTNSTLAALAVAGDGGATAGAQGTLRFKTGEITIADNAAGTVTFSEAFGSIPAVMAFYLDGINRTTEQNYGEGDYYYLLDVTASGFSIFNSLGTSYNFTWIAIGV
jgi:hypothetical protein